MWNPPPPGSGPGSTPPGYDPGATQPTPIIIPGVTPGAAAPGAPPPPAQGKAKNDRSIAPGGAYDHRQGYWPAHLLARFLAFALDTVGIAFVLAAFGFDLVDHGSLALAPRHDQNGWFVLVALSLAIAVAFAFLCEALFGTTLGKSLFMLHVRRVDGQREGFGRALVRYLLVPIDLLAIGPLLALVTPKHRRLGDFAAGTVVGRSRVGPLATVLAAVLLALLGYAQAAYGGGFTSALGISAETATYLPMLVGGVASGFGHALPGGPGVLVPAPTATPFASATPYPSTTDAASPEGTASASASSLESAAPTEPSDSPPPTEPAIQ